MRRSCDAAGKVNGNVKGQCAPHQTLTRRALLRGAGTAAGLGLAARFGMSPAHVGATNAITLTPPTTTIPAALFGMHVHRATDGTPWPHAPFKVWQLWDAGVMWSDLEPRRGVYQWAKLDAIVALAQQHGVEPVLVLGLTPTWASSHPEQISNYGPGTSPAMPATMQDWTNYIAAVATRYLGRIRAYEIWNRTERPVLFGRSHRYFRLTQAAHDTLKRIDPTIQVVSPSFMNDPDYLDIFLGYGGGRYIDVLGYHFYTAPGPPEDMIPSAARVKRVMANRGLAAMPIWNTEIGWQSDNFADDDQRMGFVARTAITNWATGIDRFSWYALGQSRLVQALDDGARRYDSRPRRDRLYDDPAMAGWRAHGILREERGRHLDLHADTAGESDRDNRLEHAANRLLHGACQLECIERSIAERHKPTYRAGRAIHDWRRPGPPRDDRRLTQGRVVEPPLWNGQRPPQPRPPAPNPGPAPRHPPTPRRLCDAGSRSKGWLSASREVPPPPSPRVLRGGRSVRTG